MATAKDYAFLGVGEIEIALTNPATGDPLDFDRLAGVTALNIAFSRAQVERKNYSVPGTPTDRVINGDTKAALSMACNDLSLPTLQYYFGGIITPKTSGTVTNEVLPFNFSTGYPTPMTDDIILATKEANVAPASIVLKHGSTLTEATTGPGGTTVAASNYTVDEFGSIRINAAYLQSIATRTTATFWAVSYSFGAQTQFGAGSKASSCTKRVWLRVKGKNQAECGTGRENQLVDIYKAVLTPDGGWDLIGDDLATLNFSGSVLFDPTRTVAADEQFFRVRRF